MDSKITLSFNKDIIEKAKDFASQNIISLSRLTEYLYSQITSGSYLSLEDLPISKWIDEVAEGAIEYKKSSSKKALKDEFFKSRK
ncbi:DUF6364 family protein [Algoriphagus sp. PAP.12]|uniref:DUF6364 family protein n=1 Tax=Algoriphagus sp. PAP.12 TaxID=2996678 RepID=UPI00227A3442|nr:DUF6364 family protein [Algoriphagus sp. PAP.12]